jgi:hypothetical protein
MELLAIWQRGFFWSVLFFERDGSLRELVGFIGEQH